MARMVDGHRWTLCGIVANGAFYLLETVSRYGREHIYRPSRTQNYDQSTAFYDFVLHFLCWHFIVSIDSQNMNLLISIQFILPSSIVIVRDYLSFAVKLHLSEPTHIDRSDHFCSRRTLLWPARSALRAHKALSSIAHRARTKVWLPSQKLFNQSN